MPQPEYLKRTSPNRDHFAGAFGWNNGFGNERSQPSVAGL